jgi:hypothetical protein
MKPLTQRDKRALKLMAIGGLLIIGYFKIFEPVMESYRSLRCQREQLQKQLGRLTRIQNGTGEAQYKELFARVPALEMPKESAPQGVLFRDELTQQLQKAGIQARTLQLRESRAKRQDGFEVLTVDVQGRCGYEPMLRLLEDLKHNPYYVGVEKCVLRVDAKNRNEMTFQLAVFTYAK